MKKNLISLALSALMMSCSLNSNKVTKSNPTIKNQKAKIVQKKMPLRPTVRYDSDPVIASFEGVVRDENFSCWDTQNNFKSDECKFTSESCTLLRNYDGNDKISLEFNLPKGIENAFTVRVDSNREPIAFYGLSWDKIKLYEIPVGSHIIAFHQKDNEYSIILDEKVERDKKFEFEIKKPIKRVKFQFDPNWIIPNAKSLKADFMDSSLKSPEDEKIFSEIVIPEGEFLITFSYWTLDLKTHVNRFKVSASPSNTETETVLLKESDFKLENEKFDLQELKSTLTLYPNFGGHGTSVQKGFYGNLEVTIPEKNLNVTSFYDLIKGELVPKPDTSQKILDATKGLPRYSLKISGQCAKYYQYKIFSEYSLYSKPDIKSVELGKIKLLKDDELENLKYFDSLSSKSYSFIPNIHDGKCGDYTHLFYHHAKASSGDWVNLGNGPWGADGWTKVRYHRLYDGSFTNFKFKENEWVGFEKQGSKIFAVGTRAYGDKNGDLVNEKFKSKVSESEIFDDKGKLKIKLNCNPGC